MLAIVGRRRHMISVRRGRIRHSISNSDATFSERGTIVVTPPSTLSFSRNGEETIAFFDQLKAAIFTDQIYRRKGKFYPAYLSVELKAIRHISVPCAIVLGCELKRWAARNDFIPKIADLQKWSPRVVALLADLGCLSHLRIRRRVYSRIVEAAEVDQIQVVELTSAELQDAEQLRRVQTRLSEAIEGFSRNPKMHRALLEATCNCIDHAYNSNLTLKYPPKSGSGRWYATASFDPSSRSLRFFVYDQGAGIPESLRSKPTWMESMVDNLRRLGVTSTDANLIEAAFELGRSRTGFAERGKGFRDIFKVLELAGSGYLRVISGAGDVTINSSGKVEKSQHKSHIGGTLIEWSLPFDALY